MLLYIFSPNLFTSPKTCALPTFTNFVPKASQLDMYIFYTNTYVKYWHLSLKSNCVFSFLCASLMMTIHGWNMQVTWTTYMLIWIKYKYTGCVWLYFLYILDYLKT
jgi:hypothetical protein